MQLLLLLLAVVAAHSPQLVSAQGDTPPPPPPEGGGGGIHIYQECNIELVHEDDPWPGRHRRQTAVPARCRRDVEGGVRCVAVGDEELPLTLAGGGLNIYISCHHKGDQGGGPGWW